MSSSSRPDDLSIDLGVILRALWRAKWWMVPLVLLVAVGTAAGLSSIAPKYKGEAKILIEPQQTADGRDGRNAETLRTLVDQEGVVSQVQLITSRDLVRRVVAELKLGDRREFNEPQDLFTRLLTAIGIARDPQRISPEERWLDAFYERLQVYQIEKSRVIQIDFTSTDPDLAAAVANAVVRAFLAGQATAKLQSTSDTTRWLDGEIDGLRRKVADSEAKVEEYRSRNELFAGNPNSGTLVQQQLAELNTQVTAARGQKSDAEARASQVKRMLDRGGSLDGASEVLNSAAFQRLRERQVAIRSRLAELSAVYLPAHPQYQAVQAQVGEVDREMRAEAQKVLAALQNDVRIADQRIKELRDQLAEYKAVATRSNEGDIQLRALEREAKAQRDLLETFLARYRDAASRQSADAQPPDARVVSEATPPARPFFPKVGPLTGVVTLAAFLLFATLVVMRELVTGRALRPVTEVAARPSDGRPNPLAKLADVAAPPSEPPKAPPVPAIAPVPAAALETRGTLLARAAAFVKNAVPKRAGEPQPAPVPPPVVSAQATPKPPPNAPTTDPVAAKARPAGEPSAAAPAGRLPDLDATTAGKGGPSSAAKPPPIQGAGSSQPEGQRPARPAPEEPAASDATGRLSAAMEALGASHLDNAAAAALPVGNASGDLDALWQSIAKAAGTPGVIAVASTESVAAARTVALGLARTAARSAARICLVSLVGGEHDLEGVVRDKTPGVAALIAGKASFADIIARDRRSRAHVVSYGESDALPADLSFAATIEALAATYDAVIVLAGHLLDGPASMLDLVAEADHAILATDGAEASEATKRIYAALVREIPDRVRLFAADRPELTALAA